VMLIEKPEKIDILKEFSELKRLEAERQEVERNLEGYISQLIQLGGEQNEN